MIPAAIIESEAHRLKEGEAAGTALKDLPDHKLAAVVAFYGAQAYAGNAAVIRGSAASRLE